MAELVTSNGRDRRTFREPGAALKVVRQLGVATGRFALEEWDISAPKPKAWERPAQSIEMKNRRRRADESAAFEAAVLQALKEADDPSLKKIPHAEAMPMLDAKMAEIGKKQVRKTYE